MLKTILIAALAVFARAELVIDPSSIAASHQSLASCMDSLPSTNKTVLNIFKGRCLSARVNDDNVLEACCVSREGWERAALPLAKCTAFVGEIGEQKLMWGSSSSEPSLSEHFQIGHCTCDLLQLQERELAPEAVKCKCFSYQPKNSRLLLGYGDIDKSSDNYMTHFSGPLPWVTADGSMDCAMSKAYIHKFFKYSREEN
ncbi:hypothetical protein CCHR01_10611 [Colletotrichum chrysophilum]|uniref:Cyanovirin-N domain-containing protein n=1 Tax=Colletotrichum chrysophilum TaxID=1836956 RepID=A0AAD9AFM7_9PEZI|nr:hypothetical protein CCHR01_10611 [Colletotrichum chrysophilum]